MDQCMYCNSTNLHPNIIVGQNAETGGIGLKYHTKFLVLGVEPFYADLCKDCGSIRLHIKNSDKNWCTKK
jgi:hypothetical protein